MSFISIDNLNNLKKTNIFCQLPNEIIQIILSYLYPSKKNIIFINKYYYNKYKNIVYANNIHNELTINKYCITSLPSLSSKDLGLKLSCNQKRKDGSVFCPICGYLYKKNFTI